MRKSRTPKGHLLSMRFVSLSLAFCGFAVVLWLLYQNDYRAVLRTVADVGGGLAIVVLIRGVLLAVCSLACSRAHVGSRLFTLRAARPAERCPAYQAIRCGCKATRSPGSAGRRLPAGRRNVATGVSMRCSGVSAAQKAVRRSTSNASTG